MEDKKPLKLKRIILALGNAAKNIHLKKINKEETKKRDIEKRRALRQKKVEKLRAMEKARLKRQYKNLLTKKIELLERQHADLKKSKKYKKSDFGIKKRISSLKKRIKDL